jgi:hypothetical protein
MTGQHRGILIALAGALVGGILFSVLAAMMGPLKIEFPYQNAGPGYFQSGVHEIDFAPVAGRIATLVGAAAGAIVGALSRPGSSNPTPALAGTSTAAQEGV